MRRSRCRFLSRDDAIRFFGCSAGRLIAFSQEMTPLCRLLCRSPRRRHLLRKSCSLLRDEGKFCITGHNHGHHLKYVTNKLASFLGGTHHGHLEVAGRQDVEHAIILALASGFASLFCSKLRDRGRLREVTAALLLACSIDRLVAYTVLLAASFSRNNTALSTALSVSLSAVLESGQVSPGRAEQIVGCRLARLSGAK
jgi:hypothetical protein